MAKTLQACKSRGEKQKEAKKDKDALLSKKVQKSNKQKNGAGDLQDNCSAKRTIRHDKSATDADAISCENTDSNQQLSFVFEFEPGENFSTFLHK